MKTKVHQVKKVKEKFLSNQQFIQELGISELEYKNLILEIGCNYLEQEFPRRESYSEKWYLEYAYSKSFWKWWKLEWNNWLTDLIERHSFYNGATLEKAMAILIHRNGTKDSFYHNYIKLIHNGSTNL